MAQPFRVLLWFLQQAVTVGGLGVVWFAFPFLMLTIVAIILFSRQPGGAATRLMPLLVTLPAIWIFLGLWGSFFWADWAHGVRNPHWIVEIESVGLYFFPVAAAFFVWGLPGARLFALVYAVINFYFTFAVAVLAGMAVGGVWL